jgi:thiol-disulfide isomerase/thioredoxin
MNKNFFAVITLIATATFGYFFYVGLEKETAPIASQEIVSTPANNTIVDFSLPDLDGIDHQISEWDGKARLINFWATWCAPCRREIPLLKQTQTAHAKHDLQVIGIAVDFVDPVKAYAEEAEFNYPVLIGQEDAMAAAEATGIDFIGMPFTMIVAPDGQLIKTHIGEIHEDQMALIVETFEQMRSGKMDLASARSTLKAL